MPSVPPGGLILVIGASGYIASVTIQAILQRGCRVRGIVRFIEANSWMSLQYGPNFKLIQVQDINGEHAFDDALKDVDGIAHMAMDMTLDPNDLAIINAATKTLINLLEAASKHPTVRGLVIYAAAKVRAEQEARKWIQAQSPRFTFNVVLPDSN